MGAQIEPLTAKEMLHQSWSLLERVMIACHTLNAGPQNSAMGRAFYHISTQLSDELNRLRPLCNKIERQLSHEVTKELCDALDSEIAKREMLATQRLTWRYNTNDVRD